MRSSKGLSFVIWSVVFFLGTVAGAASQSLNLVPLPELKFASISMQENQETDEVIPCQDVAARFDEAVEMASNHNLALANDLGGIVNVIGQWYSLLSPLEGQNHNIPDQYFSPLDSGQKKISQLADAAFDNAGIISRRFDWVRQSLRNCLR